MSGYKRFITYIYEYEGEEKGKNVGFAKIDRRDGRCKISVSVKNVYVGGKDLVVYLLTKSGEIELGKIFVRNGAGEFRNTIATKNYGDMQFDFSECYGITIHDPDDGWRRYTTIWDDAVEHAAVVDLEKITSENVKKSDDAEKEKTIIQEIEQELEAEDIPEPKDILKPEAENEVKIASMEITPEIQFNGNAEKLQKLDEEETAEADPPADLWDRFQKCYPKIKAFEYDGEYEAVMIKPQDIGMLPREIWKYGNNSFLLHGYYNYRYIIFSKIKGKNNNIKYLLGVPGHYCSNEKYMASMFGFSNFVLSGKQIEPDERFGYWYTYIHI